MSFFATPLSDFDDFSLSTTRSNLFPGDQRMPQMPQGVVRNAVVKRSTDFGEGSMDFEETIAKPVKQRTTPRRATLERSTGFVVRSPDNDNLGNSSSNCPKDDKDDFGFASPVKRSSKLFGKNFALSSPKTPLVEIETTQSDPNDFFVISSIKTPNNKALVCPATPSTCCSTPSTKTPLSSCSTSTAATSASSSAARKPSIRLTVRRTRVNASGKESTRLTTALPQRTQSSSAVIKSDKNESAEPPFLHRFNSTNAIDVNKNKSKADFVNVDTDLFDPFQDSHSNFPMCQEDDYLHKHPFHDSAESFACAPLPFHDSASFVTSGTNLNTSYSTADHSADTSHLVMTKLRRDKSDGSQSYDFQPRSHTLPPRTKPTTSRRSCSRNGSNSSNSHADDTNNKSRREKKENVVENTEDQVRKVSRRSSLSKPGKTDEPPVRSSSSRKLSKKKSSSSIEKSKSVEEDGGAQHKKRTPTSSKRRSTAASASAVVKDAVAHKAKLVAAACTENDMVDQFSSPVSPRFNRRRRTTSRRSLSSEDLDAATHAAMVAQSPRADKSSFSRAQQPPTPPRSRSVLKPVEKSSSWSKQVLSHQGVGKRPSASSAALVASQRKTLHDSIVEWQFPGVVAKHNNDSHEDDVDETENVEYDTDTEVVPFQTTERIGEDDDDDEESLEGLKDDTDTEEEDDDDDDDDDCDSLHVEGTFPTTPHVAQRDCAWPEHVAETNAIFDKNLEDLNAFEDSFSDLPISWKSGGF